MEISEIIEALNGNADLLNGVISHVITTEKGTEIVTNKANVLYKEKIGDELSLMYKKQDDNIFTILGERPGTNADGGRQKTYEKQIELFNELAELRKVSESLTKDEKVKELNAQIEQLKAGGGGKHWEDTFNAEKVKWNAKETTYLEQIETAKQVNVNFVKSNDIDKAFIGLKFDETIPEDARKALIKSEKESLVKRSRVEDGKVIYFDEDGKTILTNDDHSTSTASDLIKQRLKSVLFDEQKSSGGNAQTKIDGSIKMITDANGKSVVSELILNKSLFKTRVEFLEIAEKALLAYGITRKDPNWDKLKNDAYTRYGVLSLPRN